jgi:hypothetical protein
MKNKAFFIKGSGWIARPGQFCNGPLQNWDLNIRLPDETFRTRTGGMV